MRIELITICEEAEDEISNNEADRDISKEIVEEALQKADELFEEKFSLLKHKIKCELEVAPHAGAWIETNPTVADDFGGQVAPHAGAWIETS